MFRIQIRNRIRTGFRGLPDPYSESGSRGLNFDFFKLFSDFYNFLSLINGFKAFLDPDPD